MLRLIALAAIVTAFLVIPACCSCPETTNALPRTEVHYSSGGGVTGMSSGFSILSDGSVTRWTGRAGVHDQETTIGRLDNEDYQALLSDIQATGYTSLRQQETGNMTTSLRIVRGEEVVTFTWPGLHIKENDVPELLLPLRNAIWKRIEAVQQQSGE